MKRVNAAATTAWFLICLSASSAHGDGVCEKGHRDFSESERATMTSALENAKTALPAAPQGWTILGDDTISVPTGFCTDYEGASWSYHFSRSYQKVEGDEARNDALQAAANDMNADMAKKQPRLDALMAKMQELSQEVAAAATKGDYARAEEINKELEKVGAEYTSTLEQGGTIEKANAAVAEAFRDVQMTVSVDVNPKRESPAQALPLPVPAGADAAFRWADTGDDVKDHHALVLIGPWKAAGDGVWEVEQNTAADLVAPRAMAVRFSADEKRLAAMIEATDFKALKAALAR